MRTAATAFPAASLRAAGIVDVKNAPACFATVGLAKWDSGGVNPLEGGLAKGFVRCAADAGAGTKSLSYSGMMWLTRPVASWIIRA